MRWLAKVRAGTVLVLAVCAASCQTTPGASEHDSANLPAATPRVEIRELSQVGPYLAADVHGAAGTMRFYFATGGSCRAVLQEAASAFYLPQGRFGSLATPAEEGRCEPVGVADLAAWRDRLPRRRSRFLQPREIARFRPAGSGAGVLLARGAFPLAIELLFPNPEDLVAVLPALPACHALLAARSGILEFLAEGPEPLLLRGTAGVCPVHGLAVPLALD